MNQESAPPKHGRRRRLAVTLLLLMLVAISVLTFAYVSLPTALVPELHVGIVGAYDKTLGAQITGGKFWFGDRSVPEKFSAPVRTHPGMRHRYGDPNFFIHPTTAVPSDATFDQIFALLFPGATSIEPPMGPVELTSTNEREIEPTVQRWTCFFQHPDGKLDSAAILVFADVYREERVALVLRAERNGSRWFGEVNVEDFRPAIQYRSAGFKKHAWGHVLSISVGRMKSLDDLPGPLRGQAWFEPGAR